MEFLDKEFWPEYPRKEKKKAAVKALWKLHQHQQHGLEFLRRRVLAAVHDQKRHGARLNPASGTAYIPLAASWLNGEEWENQAPAESEPSAQRYTEYLEAE